MAAQNAKSGSAWFDESSDVPIIDEQAQQLESFLAAMADGGWTNRRCRRRRRGLVKLMKEVEPLFDDGSAREGHGVALRDDGLRPDADVARDA